MTLLAASSWFDHLDRLQQTLRLEAIEMVQLADALSAGPADPPRLAHLLAQRLPRPTGFCQLRERDGRLLFQRGRPSGLVTLSAGDAAPSSGWLAGETRSPLTGLNSVSSVSLEQAVVLWASRNLIPGILILGAGLLMLTVLGQLETAHVELRRSSRHALQDALTGLPNRRAFDAAFQRLSRATARDQRPISALFIDIDRFKQLNDQLGHAAGDRALRAVAGAIRRSLLRPTDFCCRWGGEEFVVLLPDTDARGALQTAQRILERVRQLRPRGENSHGRPVTVSVGIASPPAGTAPGPELVLNADQAMLEAKHAGRDCWVVWRPPVDNTTASTAQAAHSRSADATRCDSVADAAKPLKAIRDRAS